MKIKVGETITDGYKVWVLGRDDRFHYINSGRRATHHVTTQKLKDILEEHFDTNS